jgi:peptide/nickel transport system substrate-binding protein
MKSRKLLVAVILLVVCIVFAGTSPAAETKKRGGTLIVGLSGDLPTLNPGLTTIPNVFAVAGCLFNSLISLDFNMNPVPDLAESWKISPDGKKYTFKLFKNVKWHDGKPFTSADVKFTFEKILIPFHPRGKAAFESVESIDTTDPYTVVFNLKYAFAPLFSTLVINLGPILPKHLYEGTDVVKNPRNMDKPIGTGPFKFQEWAKGSHIILTRNENYFKKGKPYLNRVIFKIINDINSRTMAMEKGEIDVMLWYGMPLHEVQRLKGDPNIAVVDPPTNILASILMINMNLRNPILKNQKVREALAYAIDKDVIVQRASYGLGKVATGPIPASFPWAYTNNVKKYSHNPTQANQLLDEAGFPKGADGKRFKISLIYQSGMYEAVKTAEIVVEQLKEVGIDLVLKSVDTPTFSDAVFMRWDFDMAMERYASGPDPAIGVQRLYVTSNIRKVPGSNCMGYSNKEVDALFDEAARVRNMKKRGELYTEVQKILTNELPCLWIFEMPFLAIHRNEFVDVIIDPTVGYEGFQNTTWKKATGK